MNLKQLMGRRSRVSDDVEYDFDIANKLVKLSRVHWSYDEFERLTGIIVVNNTERYAYDDLNAQTRYVALYWTGGVVYSNGSHGYLIPAVHKNEMFSLSPSSSSNSSMSFGNVTEAGLRKAEDLFAKTLKSVGINADVNLKGVEYEFKGRRMWRLRLNVTPHETD